MIIEIQYKLEYRYAKCKVLRVTLMDRLKGRTENVGRPIVLTAVEEELMVERIKLFGDWGYALDNKTLRYWIKDYLDATGKSR